MTPRSVITLRPKKGQETKGSVHITIKFSQTKDLVFINPTTMIVKDQYAGLATFSDFILAVDDSHFAELLNKYGWNNSFMPKILRQCALINSGSFGFLTTTDLNVFGVFHM